MVVSHAFSNWGQFPWEHPFMWKYTIFSAHQLLYRSRPAGSGLYGQVDKRYRNPDWPVQS